ncbi:MAG: glutamate-5-semialdehyde dehydrogenase [Bdellovibrionota bacterium]|nr:glutamate-5-semialdehyde dehydrogenase [Bdellovibrionota bacterium]
MAEWGKQALQAKQNLRYLEEDQRTKALESIAKLLRERLPQIIKANLQDMQEAKKMQLNSAMTDRLLLDEKRILNMADGVESIAKQQQVVGNVYSETTNEKGLKIARQRVPLGVILMIFESRPNVVIDCAALAIKSGNAILLKGGKEAKHSNEFLGDIINEATKEILPEHSVQVLKSDDRNTVNDLLSKKEFIDLVIPRGGKSLIEHVYENARMPVIAHFEGLCHMYIDSSAKEDMALELIVNAKTHRTGVCNAMESLLVHESLLLNLAPKITKSLQEKGTELRVDQSFKEASGYDLKLATEEDWATEYLDNILSIKTVHDLDEAIAHIDRYGTNHTEAIVSETPDNVDKFFRIVDASCLMHNASTRFNDGGELGLGAELGISTTKIHAYGPMGAEEMTSSRFVVLGSGQVRS